MRIHSISTVLAIPFVLCAIAIWFLVSHFDPYFIYYFLAPIMCLVVIYMSHGYLDYWWHVRYPIPLDKPLVQWLETHDTFYQGLDAEKQSLYTYRIGLYLEARSFQSVGKEQRAMPEDVKILFAATAVKLTMAHDDFLIGDYDRIFVYNHPFPSPKHQYLHTVETDGEDGVMIFALDYGVKGFTEPHQYYNTILHGYAEAFVECHPELNFPHIDSIYKEKLEAISGYSYSKILDALGYKEASLLPILIVQYFDNPTPLESHLPEVYAKLHRILGTQNL